MRMEVGLQFRQQMRLKLAPQIIQSIEILQLPLMALRQRIEQELLENPILEATETTDQADAVETPQEERPTEERVAEVTVESSNEAEQYERLADLTSYYDDFSKGGGYKARSLDGRDAKQDAFENSPAPDISLEEHLRRQLVYVEMGDTIQQVCDNIIANLDSRGYLAYPMEEIIASMETEVMPGQAEEALKIVQGLEPPGVGARDVKECLVLQLDPRQKDYEFLRGLITEHLDDILKNRYPKVAREAGCTLEELKAAVEDIAGLNPIPGSLFGTPRVPHVLPDLRIEEVDGEYIVALENTWLPSLAISSYYARRLQQKDLDPKTREYLKKKLQSAQGFISAVQQRRATLYKVTDEIVKAQKEYFDKGRMHLKPLKMQDVADRVSVHVSTVSRAISDKYVQTPRGISSLKYFFVGGLAKENGEMESWEVVRHKLLDIVANEDKHKPLNDEEIARKLKMQGIEIARRTVSKYRQNLNLPSSRLRREY